MDLQESGLDAFCFVGVLVNSSNAEFFVLFFLVGYNKCSIIPFSFLMMMICRS